MDTKVVVGFYLQSICKKNQGPFTFIMRMGHNEIYDGKNVYIMHSFYLAHKYFFTRFPSFGAQQ